SRKRKAIRKERREVESAGLNIQRLVGDEITTAHWDAMYGFYMDTGARKWGQPYLNREFFTALGERLGERVMMVVANDRHGDDENIIAGALNLIGGDALYGRYWGCTRHVDFLHFELCYYQAIEAAIERNLSRVEAGAQGEHKIARGYLPHLTKSAHWIADPGFFDAISDFTKREAGAVKHEKALLDAQSPYRDDAPAG
ncbi:MAG: GNAT family N-acetyltransferase, partial [Rhodospirillaceae bacterium]|nr:GNAT family N-acetyltransferase [Rhodospirillaceae bacterium]